MVDPTLGLAVIVGLVAASALFSSSEIALFSLDSRRLASIAADGTPGGERLARLRGDPHRLLVTILVGNNLVNIAIASLATALLVTRFSGDVAAVISTVVVSTVVLIFGEIVPKSYGVANAEDWSLRTAPVIDLVGRVLFPLVAVFEAITGVLNRFVGGEPDIEAPYVSREALTDLVRTAEAQGVIGDMEESLIQRAFRFGEVTAGEADIPRADIVAIEVGTSIDEALRVGADARLTRLPVYQGTLDTVVGHVDIRDLLRAEAGTTLRDLLRPVLQVYEGQLVAEVLAELQEERIELAVVFDEFGAVDGLLTTEDIVEEVVGEIYDVGERTFITPTGEHTVSARGRARVGEVAEALGLTVEADSPLDTDTSLAGLVTETLGRPAGVGETVTVGDLRLTVESVDDNRVLRVLVERLDPPEDAPE